MQLVIELPSREEQWAFNKKRWEEVCADSFLASLPHRIETDAFGQIIMSPPAHTPHARKAYKIAKKLENLMACGEAFTECPISTSDGVRTADAVWISEDRLRGAKDEGVQPVAPEICVEVVSPRNTHPELRHKKALYFDSGTNEVWLCGLDGTMRFFEKTAPLDAMDASRLCEQFPHVIELS